MSCLKKWLKWNHVGSVIWLAWRGDTGNGLCAEQTPRLTVAEARETAPPPTSVDGKDAFVRVCVLSSQRTVIYLNQENRWRKLCGFLWVLSSPHGLIKVLDAMYWMIKGFWKFNVSVQAKIHTWRAVLPHTLIYHTHSWFAGWSVFLRFPLLWFLFQVLNQRGDGLVGGERKGSRGC